MTVTSLCLAHGGHVGVDGPRRHRCARMRSLRSQTWVPAYGAPRRVSRRGPLAGTTTFSALAGLPSPLLRLVLARLLGAGEDLLGDEAGVLADRGFDLGAHVGVVLEERLGVLAALADALRVVGEPGARLLHHAGLHPEVEDLAGLGDALPVHDV